MKRSAKILFVTRNYPPAIGGMEKYAFDLYNNLGALADVTLVANGKGLRHLPFFLVKVLLILLFTGHRYTHIHFGDGVLSPVALLCRIFGSQKVSITIHALDITFDNFLYQAVIPFCVSKLDVIVCVSDFTKRECVKRKVPEPKCHIITNGIDYSTLSDEAAQPPTAAEYFDNRSKYKILVSVGRLIKRKGNLWFIEHVLPDLPENVVYLIGGSGPEKAPIEDYVERHGLQDRVVLLNRITPAEKQYLLLHADIFLMPNISIPGDTEGFGISIIEATAAGLPVVGSNIQGITSAIIDGETGILVNEQDVDQFVTAINSPMPDRSTTAASTRAHFDWSKLAERYLEVLGIATVTGQGIPAP